MDDAFSFRLLGTDGAARRGEIATRHGTVATPAFMPVGTQATVKGLAPEALRASGTEIVLANTYHLMLRPGAERIAALGGLHRFMNWIRPILTDSADIAMQLDECLRLPAPQPELRRAMQLSLAWAERSKRAFEQAPAGKALFGIIQGGDDTVLRTESARVLTDIGFDGYAIGGLAVGEPQQVMLGIVEGVLPALPPDRPRYLMGMGTPEDLLEAVGRGIDMFDCVLPTRNGRHGLAFTRFGPINLKNARYAEDPRPVDEASACAAARDFSRAYLHHLVRANEMLGAILLTTINLAYYQDLMAGMRNVITAGMFADFCAATRESWAQGKASSS